jgi:fumarate reductase subunit C
MPGDWWLKNKRYFAYMLRELTAVFAALWVILLLVQIPMMSAGPQNLPLYNAWIQFMLSPGWVLFSIVAFFMVCYHSVTWFILMGTVTWIRFGKAPIPSGLIISSMFVGWALISLVVAFFIATPYIGG